LHTIARTVATPAKTTPINTEAAPSSQGMAKTSARKIPPPGMIRPSMAALSSNKTVTTVESLLMRISFRKLRCRVFWKPLKATH
tara:strand:+ start:230 stop:481 length:252 start_codon:yes stop_codon:yes gene_type:complete